jgi:acetyl-CoA synthase
MPKELKDEMREDLEKRAEELGMPGLVDKIADETVATDSAALLEYLTEVEHPAVAMESLI